MVSNSAVNFLGLNFFVEQPYLDLNVRRDHIVNDTINSLMSGECMGKSGIFALLDLSMYVYVHGIVGITV